MVYNVIPPPLNSTLFNDLGGKNKLTLKEIEVAPNRDISKIFTVQYTCPVFSSTNSLGQPINSVAGSNSFTYTINSTNKISLNVDMTTTDTSSVVHQVEWRGCELELGDLYDHGDWTKITFDYLDYTDPNNPCGVIRPIAVIIESNFITYSSDTIDKNYTLYPTSFPLSDKGTIKSALDITNNKNKYFFFEGRDSYESSTTVGQKGLVSVATHLALIDDVTRNIVDIKRYVVKFDDYISGFGLSEIYFTIPLSSVVNNTITGVRIFDTFVPLNIPINTVSGTLIHFENELINSLPVLLTGVNGNYDTSVLFAGITTNSGFLEIGVLLYSTYKNSNDVFLNTTQLNATSSVRMLNNVGTTVYYDFSTYGKFYGGGTYYNPITSEYSAVNFNFDTCSTALSLPVGNEINNFQTFLGGTYNNPTYKEHGILYQIDNSTAIPILENKYSNNLSLNIPSNAWGKDTSNVFTTTVCNDIDTVKFIWALTKNSSTCDLHVTKNNVPSIAPNDYNQEFMYTAGDSFDITATISPTTNSGGSTLGGFCTFTKNITL